MGDENRPISDDMVRVQKGEEGIPNDLVKVRGYLLSLPKVSCPVGFEYRLQRKISGADALGRAAEPRWIQNWAWAGLGFAAAVVIAVAGLNYDSSSPIAVQAPVATVKTVPIPPVQQQAPANTVTPAPASTQDQQPLLAQDETAKKAKKDSTQNRKPAPLPENLYQTVSGSGR